jgi:hypothetical protein
MKMETIVQTGGIMLHGKEYSAFITFAKWRGYLMFVLMMDDCIALHAPNVCIGWPFSLVEYNHYGWDGRLPCCLRILLMAGRTKWA